MNVSIATDTNFTLINLKHKASVYQLVLSESNLVIWDSLTFAGN